ncbi:MAG: hypothetical protein A3B47_02940 [Candidatus Levybacteria bacterium RIFCSPLOWO2_01_FULL_39_24]|nr:MAG: hypothetical protein A2800_02230 [Candidatus Levybacteria bacterium RIFCSPHIGHO2_01_FULL_40_16]OGH46576.1 MAG: hypothetical protein A3B47_02940 [Candidatus Levybacteria bacterium RIFCSPLOWO2_01_FULL_39_24]
MQFFIFVLLICLFIFLYCVYVLTNDDFIFLRRDVTLEKLFNLIFISGLTGLFVARFFYGFSAKGIFANPLVFLLFPYFPGLSLLGGVVGAGIYLFFLAKHKENSLPLGRICDFFSIAFLISLPIGLIGYLMFSQEATEFIKLAIKAAIYFVLFIIFLRFFLPRLLNGKFKEGTISLIFLICFSTVSLISNAFSKISILEYFKNFENIILILIFIASAGMLIQREGLISKITQFKKGEQ